jgi:hypothetical protein
MTNDRPITPEQAMLAVKAAGLDPDKPLNEQLQGNGDLEQQVADLSEQVKALSQARAAPTAPEPHELLAKRLHDAQSEWLTYGGPGDGKAAA